MKSATHNFKPFFKTVRRCLFALAVAGTFVLPIMPARAATFPGTAYLNASDPTGALSWNTGTAAMTVECWFKISIPSGTNLTDNMTILVNRNNGDQTSSHGYLIWFNINTGNVEFSCRGSLGIYTNTLITRPYVERWYEVAVVRQNDVFTAYVDGRQVFSGSGSVGDSSNTGTMCVGGWGASKYLFGEVQEVSIYQRALSGAEIVDNLYADQSGLPNLTGYFHLGYSTNTAIELTNSAPSPASGIASLASVGPVTFEQTDDAGEQSTYDSYRNGGKDATVPLSGSFSWQQSALARPVPGIAFDFRFGYSSANTFGGYQLGTANPYASGPLGPGWRNTFETRLLPGQDFDPSQSGLVVGLMNWNGSIDTWDVQIIDPANNIYGTNYFTRDQEYRGELVRRDDLGVFQWTSPDRLLYTFRHPFNSPQVMKGRLLKIQDFNGNTVQLQWNQSIGVLTQVVDSVSGIYKFNYNAGYLLTNVTFGQWLVNFAYDTTNRLVSKSLVNSSGLYGAVNTTWQFQYGTNGLLARIVDPRGNTNLFVQYDQYGRQTNQMDALNRATVTRYGVPGNRQITRIDSGTNSWIETYDRRSHILSQQDPLGNNTSYTYDANGNRTSVTEPLGWTTLFAYDSRANVIAKTNALGEVTLWAYDSFFNKATQQITQQPPDANGLTTWTNSYAYDAGGNLTNQSDALGTLVRYTYATNGLVLTSADANGNTTSFGYDTNGFLNSRTDPATNTTFYTLNDVGWKLRETDALGNPTSYTYDLNGNATRIQDVLGRIFNHTYDASGNLLSSSDAKAQITTYAYDPANQRTNMVDRTGTNKWTYFYTVRGKLDHVTDALGNSATNTYDVANRLVGVTDPLGQSVTNQYDANGNLIAYYDKLGQRWVKGYDRLDRAISESDPLGDTKTTAYDVADRIQKITSPNGYPSLHTYDGRGRLTKWVDPQNFQWLYAYDGVGNITNITDANLGHYLMTYGPRNERTLEQNQDNNIWHYTYDELLRLKQQTDPNGVTRTPTYDFAGRIQFVDFSTGRRDSYVYDDNNNPKTVSRRVSGVTTSFQLIYDQLDRAIEQDDALGQTVLYGYDPLSRVTSITYPGAKVLTNSFDALGRLTNQVDWAGRQMNYAYDAGDRLIFRSYPNGIVQTNVFDVAGRIGGLSYSTPNPPTTTNQLIQVALNYAYDRNGNKTSAGESGTFQWPLPSLTDESTGFTPAGRMTSHQIQNNSAISNQLSTINYSYDSNGNMTNASGNGQSWALTYDEDNRTMTLYWQVPSLTYRLITNRYDALGRRVSKIVNGATTGYVLSLVGGMERVLCDIDGSGNVTARYVHGPDLCYRVDSTNGLTCYHADAMGNIIALTDGNTNLVAQYAYTPYGRNLWPTNFTSFNNQPYSFVGSQGVMEEVPGLYFMRARYYSSDAGVFFSTDPVKKIGSGWRPTAYNYALANPFSYFDSRGTDPTGMSDAIAFGIGMMGDFGWQIYKYNTDPNYQTSVSEMWMAGVKAAVETEVAEDTAGFAGSVGASAALKAASKIAAGALTSGAESIAQQAFDNKGFGNVDYGEAAANVSISGFSAGLTTLLPNISMNGNLYMHAVTGPGGGPSHVINGITHSILDTGTDLGLHGVTGSTGQGTGSIPSTQSMANQAVNAMCYASSVPVAQPAKPTTPTSTTSSGGGGSGPLWCPAPTASGNNGGANTGNHNQTTSSPTSIVSQVTTAISNVVSSIGNFFSHLF